MAFFDALTNIFTGQPQIDAAEQQRQYIAQQQAAEAARVAAAQKTGIEALQSGQAGALGSIGGGVSTARGDVTANTPEALAALYGGQGAGASALGAGQEGGLAALTSGVSGAMGAYDPLSALGGGYAGAAGQASGATADALGLNGPEGVARAQATFRSSPGYDFAVSQGLNSLVRAANVGGGAAGGNVLREAQTFGQGLADQDWQAYLANLQQRQNLYAPQATSATGAAATGRANAALAGGTGGANIYTGTAGRLSDLYSGTGTNAANIYTGQGTTLANLAQQGGLAGAGVYTGTGSGIAGLVSGLTGQEGTFNLGALQPAVKSFSDAAAAETGGSQNLWNLIGGGAKLAAGAGFLPGGSFTPWNLGGK